MCRNMNSSNSYDLLYSPLPKDYISQKLASLGSTQVCCMQLACACWELDRLLLAFFYNSTLNAADLSLFISSDFEDTGPDLGLFPWQVQHVASRLHIANTHAWTRAAASWQASSSLDRRSADLKARRKFYWQPAWKNRTPKVRSN